MMMMTFRKHAIRLVGEYRTDGCRVTIDGHPLKIERSLTIRPHSPTGFSWGYEGSGPAQLALAILLQFLPEGRATELYQDFKRDHIAHLPSGADFDVIIDVPAWIADRRQKEMEAAEGWEELEAEEW